MQRVANRELKARAKAELSLQTGSYILGFVIVAVIAFIGGIPQFIASVINAMNNINAQMTDMHAQPTAMPLSWSLGFLVFTLIYGALTYAASAGYAGMALRGLSGYTVSAVDIFSRFREFGRWALYYLIFSIRVMLWSILFVIPGIMAAYSYSQATYLMLKDPNLSGWDAIEQSTEMMSGYRIDLFLLHLSFILWILLVVVTFGLAALYVYPYVWLADAAFHRNLAGDDVEQSEVSVDFA